MHRRLTLLVVGVTLGVVSLTGCNASPSSSADPKGSRSPVESLSAKSIAVGVQAIGGHAGTADKAPVTIGFITDNGVSGIDGKPFINSMTAAVDFINKDLGGIDGRPLKVSQCEITQSEDQGTVCAQQMINDTSVVAVVLGGVNLGETEILSTIAGKLPLFASIPGGPGDAVAPDLFAFNGGVIAGGSMLTYAAKNLKAKSVSIIGTQDPITAKIVGSWKQSLNGLGVAHVTTALFPPGSTDLTPTVVASGASKSDAILVAALNTPPCVSIAKALTQLNISKPTVALGNCADPAVAGALGGLPKWTFYTPFRNDHASDTTGQVDAYVQAVGKYADSTLTHANFAPSVFATVMSMANVMNHSGTSLTSSSIASAAKAWTGPVFLGQTSVQFGVQPFPNLSNVSGQFTTYEGDGTWKAEGGGAWVEPPLGP